MPCIKTGGVAYLTEYSEWVYGDMHLYDGVLVVRAVYRTRDPAELTQFGNRRHFTIHRLADWWDEGKTSMKQNATLIANGYGWTKDGDYDGIEEPLLSASQPPEDSAAPTPAAARAE